MPHNLALARELSEIGEIKDELAQRKWFMDNSGYHRCDIAACNCNSWHGGHLEMRFNEMHDAIIEAGISLNGVTLLEVICDLLETHHRMKGLEK